MIIIANVSSTEVSNEQTPFITQINPDDVVYTHLTAQRSWSTEKCFQQLIMCLNTDNV